MTSVSDMAIDSGRKKDAQEELDRLAESAQSDYFERTYGSAL